MNDHFKPQGPYYIALVCEEGAPSSENPVATSYVDGFQSEADAWTACQAMRDAPIQAIDEDGDETVVNPKDLLQILIARTETATFPKAFKAA